MGISFDNRSRPAAKGFTLLEMLVVVMIMALVMTISGVAVRNKGNTDLETIGRTLQSDLRHARSMALVTNNDTSIIVDVVKKQYNSQAASVVRTFPDEMTVVLVVDEKNVNGETGKILFYPDGSSSGGMVRLMKNDRKIEVVTSWLNGNVSLNR